MTETATSPRPTVHTSATSHSSRPGAAPSITSTNSASSNTSSMPPLFSPRLSTPQQQTPAPKTPSPNYFGFQNGQGSFLTEAAGTQTHSNWSPPSSAVRSTAAISPTVIPLDQNPDFEAFRRQSEGKSFSLGGFGGGHLKTTPGSISLKRPGGRRASKTSPPREDARHVSEPRGVPARSLHGKADSLDPASIELSQSPKRLLSPGSLHLPEASRRGSPANFASLDHASRSNRTESSPDKAPRYQLPLDSVPTSSGPVKHRAETLPLPGGGGADDHLLTTAQHVVTLMQSASESLLLLDLRVQTQYAASHLSGSLSLCIPTTLLKRPSFNVQKLAETFKDDATKARFENWRKSKYIIVYDNSSTLIKDAQTCMNTLKKFKAEGYDGTTYVIKGGFVDFARAFPQYVESGSPSIGGTAGHAVAWDGPKVAPVVGGCPMPGTDQPANPFFGNIRQNMDLIGGVGQIALQHPAKATSQIEDSQFPKWLKQASEDRDQGKRVSSKFEAIERREKKRMEDALSTTVKYGTSPEDTGPRGSVQIAGLEKGTKNRYNNIWPFEHSRVKLQGVPTSGCDYFNANHIKAAWSNKRYISTQAPIPATFNDFWNAVWQQDVRVIVMLTAEKEGAQVKAHNYWDMKQYGPLRLEFLSEKKASLEPERIQRHRQRPAPAKRVSTTATQLPLAQIDSRSNGQDQPYVTVRRFTLSHEGFPFERMREITQLQYSSWPDFGAPAHPAHLLGLVEQTDAVVRVLEKTKAEEPEHPNPRPVLVHCSAGCGRTGTFCTVDSVIDMLKRQHLSRQDLHRHASPMDIDGHRGLIPAPDQGGFFASQLRDSKEGIEGSWVTRDDLDLVEKTVEDFRHQRLSMVQSLRQFVLCYESIMEWLIHHTEVSVS